MLTMTDMLRRAHSFFGDQTAIVCADGSSETWSSFIDKVASLAAGMSERRTGKRFAIIGENSKSIVIDKRWLLVKDGSVLINNRLA